MVYSDADAEAFVPDITSPGWKYWNIEAFRQTGRYSVYLYSYYKNNHPCLQALPPEHRTNPRYVTACSALRYRRRRIEVDVRKHMVSVLGISSMDENAVPLGETKGKTSSFSELADSPFGKEVDRISSIIEDEAKP